MKKPLIHLITNYVTVNDVVNIILSCGGSAICADAPEEVEEITGIADSLVLNIGTPSKSRFEAMLKAGRVANQRNIPVVLDPVGAGASRFRDEFLKKLLSEVKITCIRGNYTEITALARLISENNSETETGQMSSAKTEGGRSLVQETNSDFRNADTALNTGGVDSRDISLDTAKNAAKSLALVTKSVVVTTGSTDFVTDGKKSREWSNNGSYMQRLITGSGCMLSGLLGLELAKNPEEALDTVTHCVNLYGTAAHEAEEQMNSRNLYGTATFRQYLIDVTGLTFNN